MSAAASLQCKALAVAAADIDHGDVGHSSWLKSNTTDRFVP